MFRKNPGVVVRLRGDSIFVRHVGTDLSGELNESGYLIWRALDQTNDVVVIAAALAKYYGIPVDEAFIDVNDMIEIFIEHKLLSRPDSKESSYQPMNLSQSTGSSHQPMNLTESTGSSHQPMNLTQSPDSSRQSVTLTEPAGPSKQIEARTESIPSPANQPLPLSLLHTHSAYAGPFINKAGLVVTNLCNFTCRHCYVDPAVPNTMELADWEKVLDDLEKMGCMDVMVTGGEPFTVPWIWELFDLLEERKFVFSINTNLSLLDDIMVERLAGYAFLHTLSISLYGLTEKTYRQVTNRPIEPERILNTCKALQTAGIRTEIKYVVMQSTVHELALIKTFEEKFGLSITALLNPIFRRFNGDLAPLAENPDPATLKWVIDNEWVTYADQLNPLTHCSLERCSINSNGDVSLCEMTANRVFGNVHSEPLAQVWQRQVERWQIPESSPVCRQCDVKEFCSRCDGLSYLANALEDNIAKEVPLLCENARALAQILGQKKDGVLPCK